MNDRKERVLKWISFGVSLSNTVLYPYKKAVRFAAIQKEKAENSLTYFDNETTFSFDAESFSGIASKLEEGLDTTVPKKSAVEYFAQIVEYVNYALSAWNTLGTLLKLDDKDLSFLGIKVSKSFLKIVKWVLLGAGALILVSIALEKIFSSKIFATINKKLAGLLEKLMPFLSALFKIIYALYAIYLIFVLIKLQINGKKWKINDTEKLLSGVVMLLGILDIKWIEEKLADSKKGYLVAVGVSTIAKAAKTALIPFITSEQINIKKDKFKDLATDAETLFLYFCGTRENTDKHLSQFMPDIKAKYQIYVNGIGSSQALYGELYSDDVQISVKQLGNNSHKYHFETDSRNITCIEKVYKGGDPGYGTNDAEQARTYAFNAFKEVFESHAKIKKIVIAGHSRGAAVGLMSFLYKLVENSENLLPRIYQSKIAIFPLDPVAGQTSNKYPMDENWTSQDIYQKLHEKFSDKLSICEVWARTASMLSLIVNIADFHPARRLLYNPPKKSLMLSRFLLGYAHSAMVSTEEKYSKYYSPGLKSPYKLLVEFLNEYIDSLPTLNITEFKKITVKYKDRFDNVDKSVRDAGVMDYEKGIRTVYKNKDGKRINFLDFIDSYELPDNFQEKK